MVHNERVQCVNESNILIEELCALHAPFPRHHSFGMPRNNPHEYIVVILKIWEENNRMVICKVQLFLLCIAQENANDNGRELSSIEHDVLL